uniref:Uncharacterized protein n=1 Tax=Anguilla anguilla TaxID=7936 RepID=A0A0E9WQR2_ANGAN
MVWNRAGQTAGVEFTSDILQCTLLALLLLTMFGPLYKRLMDFFPGKIKDNR